MPLIGHWPLQEDSGSTAYDVARNNNGTINGATVGANGILRGSAYDFDPNNNEYIDLDGSAGSANMSSLAGSTGYSVVIWTKTSGLGGTLTEKRAAGTGGTRTWQIGTSNGHYDFIRPIGLEGTTNVEDGNWHQGVFTFEGGTFKVYTDGKFENSTTSTGDYSTSDHLKIGCRTDDNDNVGSFSDGKIADVRIYDHALTPAEVQYLYEVSRRGRFVSSKWRT